MPVWKVFKYTADDLVNDAISFPLNANTHVLAVAHVTNVAFDNAADLTVGDATDPDGWVTAAMATPTTKGDLAFSMGSAAVYAGGKFYATTSRLTIAFTATPIVGEGELRVLISGFEG